MKPVGGHRAIQILRNRNFTTRLKVQWVVFSSTKQTKHVMHDIRVNLAIIFINL